MESVKIFLGRFGEVMGRLVLGLVYFVLLGPVALVMRLFSDPLRRRTPRDSAFVPRLSSEELDREAGRQG